MKTLEMTVNLDPLPDNGADWQVVEGGGKHTLRLREPGCLTLEAAEALMAAADVPRDKFLELMEGLVEKMGDARTE